MKSQLLTGILPSSCKYAENWLKNNCTIDKNKKCYVLKIDKFVQDIAKCEGLNFDDFWVGVNSKDPFGDFGKSVGAV